MIKKKLLAINTTILLGLGSVVAAPPAFAESHSSQIEKINQNISETRSKLAKLEEQVKRVEEAIKDNNKIIAKTEQDIQTTQQEVKKLKEEIATLNENIDKRTEILKERVLSLQEAGGNVSYLEVLVGAKNFSDFIDRFYAVMQITNADNELIEQQEAEKKLVTEKQTSVDKKLSELKNKKVELDAMKAQILEQKKANDQLKKQLKQEEKENLTKKANIEAEQRRAQQAAVRQTPTNSSIVSRTNQSTKTNSFSPAPVKKYSGNVNTVVSAGYKYIGRSVYVFGGGRNQYDIANGRFDCSGFVSWAYKQAGISIPASTSALIGTGTKVSPSNMRPGDLVFFNTNGRNGHVGIYVGGGRFIGSQSNTGVATANMSSGYWKNHFSGQVRRIIN